MTSTKTLLIGLDPMVVDFAKWPGLTAEKDGPRRDKASLGGGRLRGRDLFADHGETAERAVRDRLAAAPVDIALIGAGSARIPTNPLFERLVNAVHAAAPVARIRVNTGPINSVAAVRRWT